MAIRPGGLRVQLDRAAGLSGPVNCATMGFGATGMLESVSGLQSGDGRKEVFDHGTCSTRQNDLTAT